MSLILRLLSVICCMLATTWPTTSPPRAAAWAAVPASWLAWRAVSADWVTVAVSCSMLAAVSSRLEAVCSVRADRSWLPLAISTDADDTESTPERTSVTTPRSCVDMADNERSIWPNSSLRVECSSCVRSPAAMASMALTAWSSGRVMERTSCHAMASPTASSRAAITRPMMAYCTRRLNASVRTCSRRCSSVRTKSSCAFR